MESSEKKSFQEMKEDMARSFDQFMFLLFSSNPQSRMVKIWIDGQISYSINLNELRAILLKNCPSQDVNAIMVKCMEYGTPYLYDRTNRTLKQVSSVEIEKRMDYMKKQIAEDRKVAHNEDLNSIVDRFKELATLNDKSVDLEKSISK